MKIIFFLFCLSAGNSIAHPGIGIVKDSKGNIYYTNLEHVLKISADGRKTIAVKNVHTHQLYMDKQDNLYGQHSMYSGEATNEWSHYVWKLTAKGKLDTIIKTTKGFYIKNFSFVQDDAGNMYWKNSKEDSIMKSSAKKTVVFATGDFKQVQWMHIMDNKLYFVKQDDIYCIDAINNIRLIAKDLGNKPGNHNSLFGLWSDKQKNLYVANTDFKKVQCISQNGEIKDYYYSGKGWMPTGGIFDDEGNLWLLEASLNNNVRAIKISRGNIKNEKKTKLSYSNLSPTGIVVVITLFVILIIYLGKKYKKNIIPVF
ncbi:MAG TPA: hypothetical protein VGP43_09575 [Chitinophagaceae bacterium]|nr:hypothetical protein [Chitinophagaceae bacterium]